MKRYIPWHICFLLVLLALSLQGCLGIGGNASDQNFKSVNTANGKKLQVNTSNEALFKGKLYFTQGHVLLVMDGSRNVRALTPGKYFVGDPSVSPDGRTLAFIVRYKYSSDLVSMPVNGTHWTILKTGSGQYIANPPYPAPKSTHKWFFQPPKITRMMCRRSHTRHTATAGIVTPVIGPSINIKWFLHAIRTTAHER